MDNSTTPDHMAPKGAQIWPFDRNLKSLSDIEPAAGFVATLVPEGKFGGAVAVTEETENLVTDPTEWMPDSSQYQDVEDTGEEYLGCKVSKITKLTDAAPPTVLKSLSIADGETYTASVNLKCLHKTGEFYSGRIIFYNYDTSSTLVATETHKIGEWEKIKVTYTNDTGSTLSDVRVCYYPARNAGSVTLTAAPQVEKKPFDTPFTSDTRAAGTLSYPDLAEQFNQREFTFAAWWKPYIDKESSYPRIFQTDIGTSIYGNRIVFRRGNGTQALALILPNAAKNNDQFFYFTPSPYAANQWHFVALVVDVPNLKARIHLNDEFQEFTLSEAPAMLDLQRFFLGCFGAADQLNGELDNVLYAPEAVSIETIQKWSQLTRPFIPWREPPKPYEAIIDFQATGADEIYQNVKTIIETPAGTVPFDREFGINRDLLDMPMTQAQGRLTIEYIEKIRRYEPRAKVKEVTFVHEPLSGVIKPKVVIELVD